VPRPTLSSSIRDGIRARIEDGLWTGRIPSEPELVKLFGASRETVRKALAVLEAEGQIYRVHGKGTFVEAAVSFNPLSATLSITEELARSKVVVENTVLATGWVAPEAIPSPFLAALFAGEARVWRLERLRMGRHQLLAVEVSYFREQDFPGIEQQDCRHSLHGLMTGHYGRSPDRVRNRFQALDFRKPAEREVARILQSRQILRVERALESRRHVYYGVSFSMRTDVYPLEFIQLPARSGEGLL
jgi:DNA-binding GntR family transcriptional regulator